MKNILIYGYFNNNFGDDLIIAMMAKRIRKDLPNTKLYALDSKINSIRKISPNIHISYALEYTVKILSKLMNCVPYQKCRNFLRLLCDKVVAGFIDRNIDYVFQIGGSMFQESAEAAKANRDKTVDEECQNRISDSLTVPRLVIGCNFGPYTTDYYYNYFSQYFEKCRGVYFRDTDSYEMFHDIASCEYGGDSAFLLCNEWGGVTPSCEKKCVISVMNFEKKISLDKNREYIDCICKLAESYSASGYKVSLVSFCNREGDTAVVNKILSSTECDNINALYYNDNLYEVINEFSSASVVIASRFHSIILGLIFQKKTFVFSYSDKTVNFLKDNNFPEELFCDITRNGITPYSTVIERIGSFFDILPKLQYEQMLQKNVRNTNEMFDNIIKNICR